MLTRFFIALLLLAGFVGRAEMHVQNLRCEGLSSPLGIDVVHPRLSFEIKDAKRNTIQIAYQIMVASSVEKLAKNEGDVWNSGKVLSDQSVQIAYSGSKLKSRQNCYWKVRVWCSRDQSSDWSSERAFFSIGMLSQSDWNAKWIGFEHGFPWDSVSKFSRLSARYFRKEFSNNKPIKSATAFVSGMGIYELSVNGKRVGTQVLAPAPTDFRHTVLYNTYDVTSELSKGKNAIGVVLGNGRFFTMRQNYKPKKIATFGFPKLLLQLEVDYTDGSHETIVSDESWKGTADGPIRSNNEYDGEEYDARKELKGWNASEFDDKNWLKPELVAAPGGQLVAQMSEKIEVLKTIKPLSIKEREPGVYVLDFGQNFSGWVQLKAKGKAGDVITLKFAETLQLNDSLYRRNLRDAMATDVYRMKGGEQEIWHPVFVYHGFRYVEVTGYPGKPTIDDFEGQFVSDALVETGYFESSNPLLNQIYKNAVWTVRSDYKGLPYDCPQRNERMPWLGDRAVGSLGESYMMDNSKLYAKWLNDIEDAQTPEGSIPDVAPAYWNYYSDNITWPGTYLLVSNMLLEQFADTLSVVKHYASMKKWMDYMAGKYMKDGLMTKDKYGDWCVPPERPDMIHSQDSNRNTDGVLIASAYYYHLLELMARFAALQHLPIEARAFGERKQSLMTAFNKSFYNGDKGYYSNNTVTANLLPLYFGMVPKPNVDKVFGNIIQKIERENRSHISTGVIGTQWLMRGLTEHGRADLAYKVATNDDYPSWGYMVKNGATTIWELWNGNTANPQMNSGNHVMLLGDLIAWMYEDLGGIKPASAGFKEIEMKPQPVTGLDSVNCSFQSINGLIASSWKKTADKFHWNVTVPANTKAIIYVPAKSVDVVLEGAKKIGSDVHFIRMEKGRAVYEIGSGDYVFDSEL